MSQPANPPKLILFDFDGTIANSLPLMVEVFRNIAHQHRHRHLYDIIDLAATDQPLLEHPTVKILRQQGLTPAISSFKLNKFQLAILYLRAKHQFARRVDELEPCSGMPQVLSQLAQHYQLGIITSNQTSTVQQFLNRHHLPYFSIIKSQQNLFGKSQTINQVIDSLGYTLADVVYVGDEVRDIEAAQKAGVDSIGVSWGLNSRDLLAWHHPTQVIDSPDQLPSAIDQVFTD